MISYSFKDDVWRIFHPSKVKISKEEKRRSSTDDLKKKIEETNKEIDRVMEEARAFNKKLDEQIEQISKFINEAEKALDEADRKKNQNNISPPMASIKRMSREEELKMYEERANEAERRK